MISELNNAKCGISIEKTRTDLGLRPNPWIELRCSEEKARQIQAKLLNYGISSTINNNGLRIQGINNCSLATRVFNANKWWVEAVNMMENGKHLNAEGLITIVKMRNQNSKSKSPKWNLIRVIEEINK